MDWQYIEMYVLITVLMAPLLILYGSPLLILAWLVNRLSVARFGRGARLMTVCAIAALGLTPVYDAYRAPWPLYLAWWQGQPLNGGVTWGLFALTWIALVAATRRRLSA